MSKDVLLFTDNLEEAKKELEQQGGRITHKFSSDVFVAHTPPSLDASNLQKSQSSSTKELDPTLEIVVKAWEARVSVQSRAPLATEGLSWADSNYQSPEFDDEETAALIQAAPTVETEDIQESTGTPTSLYMIGSVAVGVVVVSGNTDNLRISQEEFTKIVQEVQEGLNFLANAEPRANLSFDYDIHLLNVSVQPGTSCSSAPYEKCEAPWRNAALQQLGFSGSRTGSIQYVQDLRATKGTDWAYVVYFTKYPLRHFAYAGGERIVMQYQNDNWGPDDINRVFAHETGHIFGAADEYGSCSCGPSGHLQVANNNCVNCTASQVDCLMNRNTLSLCQWSRGQIGWDDRLLAFSSVYAQGDPGSGIGGYDLRSSADHAFAFDYDGNGKLDHLALYRPGTGTIWILRNSGGNFSPVYAQGDPGSGIGGYDLRSPADRAFAFDYDGSGKLDHLTLYRPGTGTIWILRNNK